MQMAIIDPTPALKHVAASYPLHTRSLTLIECPKKNKRKTNNGKTVHRKLKIAQLKPHENPGINS
jgi:hypothetical protein